MACVVSCAVCGVLEFAADVEEGVDAGQEGLLGGGRERVDLGELDVLHEQLGHVFVELLRVLAHLLQQPRQVLRTRHLLVPTTAAAAAPLGPRSTRRPSARLQSALLRHEHARQQVCPNHRPM